MSVAKVIELVGSSPKSWEDAAKVAIEKAGKSVRNIRGVKVENLTAKVKGKKIVEYRCNVKIAFGVE